MKSVVDISGHLLHLHNGSAGEGGERNILCTRALVCEWEIRARTSKSVGCRAADYLLAYLPTIIISGSPAAGVPCCIPGGRVGGAVRKGSKCKRLVVNAHIHNLRAKFDLLP